MPLAGASHASIAIVLQRDMPSDSDDFEEDALSVNKSNSESEVSSEGGTAKPSNRSVKASSSKSSHKKEHSPKAKRKAQRAGKASPAARGADKKCFKVDCDQQKKGNSKWCECHRQAGENIVAQAQEQGDEALENAKDIMSDPVRASKAVDQWMKDNPPGRWAKKLIDFSEWQRVFSVTTATIDQRGETAWTFEDWADEHSHWPESKILKNGRSMWTTLTSSRMAPVMKRSCGSPTEDRGYNRERKISATTSWR